MAVAPCGTPAAYRRHLRRKESPCPACRRANRDLKRAQADQRRRRAKVSTPAPELEDVLPVASTPPVEPADAAVGPPSVLDDLRMVRDALVAAIAQVRAEDPARLPGLVRELRETWKAIDTLGGRTPADGEDEFAKARQRRAERRGK